MNKLAGFFELKKSGLPCVDWKEFNPTMELDTSKLWTVRTAVERGNDLNLPRKVGVTAQEAYETASQFYQTLKDKGMVVVYPYFIADKSGTLEVNIDRIIIEAVKDDLWNLVTDNKKDVTIIETESDCIIQGNQDFLSSEEHDALKSQISKVKSMFRDVFFSGKSILLEWSFAYTTDINKNKVGAKYLVFYEARSI